MKRPFVAFVLAGLAVGGLAFSQGPAQDAQTLEERVASLEQSLGTARERVVLLEADLRDTKDQLERVADYLERQSKAGDAMARALDESERLGFTWGINPDSRHVMLAGWRDQLAELRKDVPATTATATAGDAQDRRRRR